LDRFRRAQSREDFNPVATLLLIIVAPVLFAVLTAYLVIRAGVALLQLFFLPTRLMLRR